MPEPTSEIIRRALLDAMADPDDCNADEDHCFRQHPVHLGWSVGDDVQVVYVQVNEIGAIIAAALQASGRLLPEGGQTDDEWAMRYKVNGKETSPEDTGHVFDSREDAERHIAAWRRHPSLSYTDVRYLRRVTWTGPWVAVDQEATDG